MKIGVLRANALGDVIVTIPALHALKTTYPDAELVLIGRENHKELFDGRESPVDRVIPLPPLIQFDRSLSVSSEHDILEQLRNESFDLVIQLHGGGRHSNRFVNLMNPRKSIGAKTEDAESLSSVCTYNRFQHEVLRQFEILELAGVKGPLSRPELKFTEEEKERGKRILEALGFRNQIVLINPGAKDPRRRWPADKFGEVARSLSERGAQILINAGPDEMLLAQEVKTYCPDAEIVSPGLKDLICILVNCALVISNDTGTMHLSLALKIPTVALFWFVNVLGYGPLNSDTSRLIIAWENHCSFCGHNCSLSPCAHENSLIGEITTRDVLDACQSFLQRSSHMEEKIEVEVSVGELLDKISILEIKRERISDRMKLINVEKELNALMKVKTEHVSFSKETERLYHELKRVNESLWVIEDEIRACEKAKLFDEEFIRLARSVYKENDRRCFLKRELNESLGSHLMEEKSYTEYSFNA